MRGILRHQSTDGRRRAQPRTRLFHRRVSGQTPPRSLDSAARRVRAAGGPTDEASYTCACGYVFAAPVSTTVCCPHCGSEQEW
jgi:hypothetical protein